MKKIISAFILTIAATALLAADVNAPSNESQTEVPWQYPKTWTTTNATKGVTTSSSAPMTSSAPTQAPSATQPLGGAPSILPTAPSPGGVPSVSPTAPSPGGGASVWPALPSPGAGQGKVIDKIVMFTKEACPYCQYMKPIMKEVEAQFSNKGIKFIYADIEQNPEYPSQYGFSTVPYIAYFKNDKLLDAHGSNDKTITVEQVIERIRGLGLGDSASGAGEAASGGGESAPPQSI